MRNLKKILALVLALVMSLSLMATAGAGSFSDVDADNQYKTAIDVLDELKVFQGFEDQTFRPDGKLNRAQAAVLVYRIATGDVEGKYVANYTEMANSKFTDLDGYNWAKGYINYCQNAKYVIGTSATTFDPQDDVTGYQLLVMLLRVLGYGQAGEFSNGRTWELQTAKIAEREGILKNVTTGDLGAAAPRAMVAEILFQGLLTDTVQYSIMTPDGYTKTGTTLGMQHFGLESVAGVVIANEWANLNADTVLAADTTRMETTDGKIITLNKGTDLDAVGQTHVAYIADSETKGVKRALTLALGENVVAFNDGDETSVSDLAKTESLSLSDAGYYVNYKENWKDEAQSDILIRYTIYKESIEDSQSETIAKAWIEYLDKCVTDNLATVDTIYDGDGNYYATEYTRTIRPHTAITSTDLAIMQEIFYSANRFWKDPNHTSNRWGYVEGEVFVGTASIDDVSDTMSWTKFEDEYLDYGRVTDYTGAEYGESLRVIDNNGDGKAEYVFKIEYTQDKVIATYKDELVLNSLKMADYTDNNRYDPDEVKVGDIVNYDIIDGKLSIWKADVVPGVVTTKNFRDNTVTIEGEVYNQSGITNATELDDIIMNMEDKVQYNSYLDEFGHIRTYELANGPEYALLTEMYPTTTQNWNNVVTNTVWAELTIKDADTKEYTTSAGNPFNSAYAWSQRLIGTTNVSQSGAYNYLQPAIAHLGFETKDGYTYNGWTKSVSYADSDWRRNVYVMNDYTTVPSNMQSVDNTLSNYLPTDAGFYGVFTYGTTSTSLTPPNDSVRDFSFTNVARYVLGENDSVTLSSASKRFVDKNGDHWFYGQESALNTNIVKRTAQGWLDYYAANSATAPAGYPTTIAEFNAQIGTNFFYVYDTDYVQLSIADVSAGKNHWGIDGSYATNYNTNSNSYVDALDSTEFYIARAGGSTYVEGFQNLPKIPAEYIRAVYAVAKNTSADDGNYDYWTADVIVIEVDDTWRDYDSISLMYYNPYETSGSVRYLNSLNNEWKALKAEDPDITVVPAGGTVADYAWGNHSWTNNDYGFYALYHAQKELNEAGELLVSESVKITQDYNDWGIYAAIITRMNRVVNGGGYLDVNTVGINAADSIYVTDLPFYKLVVGSRGGVSAVPMFLSAEQSASDVKKGDYIIVVRNSDNKPAFIVDLGDLSAIPTPHQTLSAVDPTLNPSWLYAIWTAIAGEQWNGEADPVDAAMTDAQDALDANAAAATDETKAALEAAKAALVALDEADLTVAEYRAVQEMIDDLDDALFNWTLDNAKYEAMQPLYELMNQLVEDYANNPNLDYALEAVQDEIDGLQADLDAITHEDGNRYTQTQIDNISTTIEDPAADALRDATSNAQDALDAEPGTLDPDVVAPTGITVEPSDDTSEETPKYDVTVPGGQLKDVTSTYSFNIQVKDGYTPAIEAVPALPAGWSVRIDPLPTQIASENTVSDYNTYVVTIKKTLSAVAWDENTDAVLVLTLTEEPETPSGDVVTVTCKAGSNLTAETAEPFYVGQDIPDITLKPASVAYTVPADADGMAITMNGTPVSGDYWDYNAGVISFVGGFAATGNIVITAAAGDQATVTTTISGTGNSSLEVSSPETIYKTQTLESMTIAVKSTAAAGQYGLPATITSIAIATDDSPTTLASPDDFTYTAATGVITFTEAVEVTGNITITADASTRDEVTVTLSDAEGTAISTGVEVASGAKVYDGSTITEIPMTVTAGYAVKAVVSVKNGDGDPLTTGFSWDAETSKIKFTNGLTVTGNLVIVMEVVELVDVTVTDSNSALEIAPTTVEKGTKVTTLTLTVKQASASSYGLPTDITSITIGGGSALATTAYSYANGVITFTGEGVDATGDIVVTAASTSL